MHLDPAHLKEILRQRIALLEGRDPVAGPSPDLVNNDGDEDKPLDLIVVLEPQSGEVHVVLEDVEVGLEPPSFLVPAVDVGGLHAGIGDEADDAEAGLGLGNLGLAHVLEPLGVIAR